MGCISSTLEMFPHALNKALGHNHGTGACLPDTYRPPYLLFKGHKLRNIKYQ